MSALIDIDRIRKDYETGDVVVHALRGVSLEVAAGEFVAIMGASGSGKSTLMNIIGCLDKPSGGRYKLDGVDVGTLSRDQLADVRGRKIAFVFQNFNLLARTPAVENVELPLLYQGVSDAERRDRAMKALEAVGLAARAGHTPNQLSGGQQQRVAIARALVTCPSIIVADEPTGALDSRTSLEVMAMLQKLHRESGITIIVVTHEPDIAACADRILHFSDGEIVRDERVSNPRNAQRELTAAARSHREEEVLV